MKTKHFISIALVAFSTSGNAQLLAEIPSKETNRAPQLESFIAVDDENEPIFSSKTPKTSFDTGLYYGRPTGAMYRGVDKENKVYSPLYLYVTPFKDIQYIPHIADLEAPVSWEYRFYVSKDSVRVVDATSDVDPISGNLIKSGIAPGYYSPAPTLVQDENTFVLGEKNAKWTENPTYYTKVYTTTDFVPLSFFDNRTAVKNSISFSSSLSTHHLFGTGIYKDSITSIGVYQIYEAPMSPLYVEDVYIKCASFQEKPIPEGLQLTMQVYNPETNDLYAILTATSDDLSNWEAKSSTNYGRYYYGTITFSQRVEDLFGVEATEPFVVDGPVAIKILGVDQKGVDIGFNNAVTNPSEDELQLARSLIRYPDGSLKSFTYKGISLNATFTGFFDAIKDNEDGNKLKVADDGTVSDYAIVYTAYPWYGYNGEKQDSVLYEGDDEYYSFDDEEIPDWVISYTAYVDEWKAASPKRGLTRIGFECEPLPEGVEGRQAKLYLKGRGVTADTPIILTQGVVIDVVPGDADEDGTVTVADITTTASYILGNNPQPFNFENADVDGDKAITVADITGTAGIILGN